MESFNNLFFNLIHGLSGRNFLIDSAGVFMAQFLPYFVFLGFLWMVFLQSGSRQKIFFMIEALLALILSRGLITEIIRYFYYSPRPFEALHFQSLIPESGSSIPSGHAAFFFALSAIIFFYNRRWGIWYFAISLLISLARIFAGVHWPFDIVAGAVVGILSALLMHFVLRKYFNELNKPSLAQ